MAKRSRKTDQATITRYQKEGRGTGNGANYKPWLTVQDVPSQGLVHRVKGWTTNRRTDVIRVTQYMGLYAASWN